LFFVWLLIAGEWVYCSRLQPGMESNALLKEIRGVIFFFFVEFILSETPEFGANAEFPSLTVSFFAAPQKSKV